MKDELAKHECNVCDKQFIVGKNSSIGKVIACPYCWSPNNEEIVWADKEKVDELELGCLNISVHAE